MLNQGLTKLIMHKTFPDIDTNYRNALLGCDVVTDSERITYCQKAIDKAQFLLEATRKYLSTEQRQLHIDRILAAQLEIKRLRQALRIGYGRNVETYFQLA
jgi:hypothetical protein